MDIHGPAGKVIYLGRGYMRVKYPGKPEQIRFTTDLRLIAGGTGSGRKGGGGGGEGGENENMGRGEYILMFNVRSKMSHN